MKNKYWIWAGNTRVYFGSGPSASPADFSLLFLGLFYLIFIFIFKSPFSDVEDVLGLTSLCCILFTQCITVLFIQITTKIFRVIYAILIISTTFKKNCFLNITRIYLLIMYKYIHFNIRFTHVIYKRYLCLNMHRFFRWKKQGENIDTYCTKFYLILKKYHKLNCIEF